MYCGGMWKLADGIVVGVRNVHINGERYVLALGLCRPKDDRGELTFRVELIYSSLGPLYDLMTLTISFPNRTLFPVGFCLYANYTTSTAIYNNITAPKLSLSGYLSTLLSHSGHVSVIQANLLTSLVKSRL